MMTIALRSALAQDSKPHSSLGNSFELATPYIPPPGEALSHIAVWHARAATPPLSAVSGKGTGSKGVK